MMWLMYDTLFINVVHKWIICGRYVAKIICLIHIVHGL